MARLVFGMFWDWRWKKIFKYKKMQNFNQYIQQKLEKESYVQKLRINNCKKNKRKKIIYKNKKSYKNNRSNKERNN